MEKIINKKSTNNKHQIILALHNIRSTHNVGAIFRTADAVGVSKMFLIGVTPDPIDRFGRKRSDVAKAALGAEENIKWQHLDDGKFLTKVFDLKKEGFEVMAIEQSKNSIDYKNIEASGKTLIIVGNEVNGLSKEIIKVCDYIAEIPMLGEKESLNVSVATGVALFRIFNI